MSDSSMHTKKSSFFKTMPKNIATSPTGIMKLSNSPFPSLDPSKHFRSVYERAGFDVYKPNSKQGSRVNSPTTKDFEFRSQSASQMNQRTSIPKAVDGKRNCSEHHNTGINKPQASLTIDSRLANRSRKDVDIITQASTASSGTTTFDKSNTNPLISATSSNFTDLDARSGSTQTSSKVNQNICQSNFVSAYSLPYSSHKNRSSRDSGSHTSASYPVSKISPTKQEFDDPVSPNNAPYSTDASNEYNQHSFQGNNNECDRSIDTVKYTPAQDNNTSYTDNNTGYNNNNISYFGNNTGYNDKNTNRDANNTGYNSNNTSYNDNSVRYNADAYSDLLTSSVPGAFPDVSYDEANPLSNSTNLNSFQKLDVEGESDNESFESEILSPKNQHFNFETSKSSIEDDNTSSFHDTTRDLSFNLLESKVAPELPVHQYEPSPLPQVTVSDANGNTQYQSFDDEVSLPSDKKYGGMRQSSLSIAASSIYSNEYRQSTTTPFSNLSEFDVIDENDANEDYSDLPLSPGPVYEEIEQQLKSLSLKSPQPDQSPLIQVHLLKETSTDALSDPEDEEIQTMQKPIFNDDKSNRVLNEGLLAQEDDEYFHNHDDNISVQLSQQLLNQEPKVPKYPPGEGPCRKCGLEIERKPIYSKSGELSGQWHRECFTCTSCDLRFNKNTSCFVLKNLPYCEYHYHVVNNSLCKVCGSGIVGKCLENDVHDRYHVDCLKCLKCEDFINSDYLSINGAVHCESCATEFTSVGVTSNSNEVIERRRTKLYFI